MADWAAVAVEHNHKEQHANGDGTTDGGNETTIRGEWISSETAPF